MTLLAIAWAAVSVLAAHWQWTRYEDKAAAAHAIEAHYTAEPVPFASVLPSPAALLGESQQWTRVSVTGRYDAQHTFVVRNRSQSTGVGYEVLVPLDTPGGVVFVDRGWVGNAAAANILPTIPPPASGEVTVTGWLRSPESDVDRSLPQGQLATVDTVTAAAQLGRTAYQPYLVMGGEQPTATTPLTALDPPSTDLGPHQGYSVQWALFTLFGFVFVGLGVRNELRAGRAAAEEAGEITPVPARPKKVRIWDEEDE